MKEEGKQDFIDDNENEQITEIKEKINIICWALIEQQEKGQICPDTMKKLKEGLLMKKIPIEEVLGKDRMIEIMQENEVILDEHKF